MERTQAIGLADPGPEISPASSAPKMRIPEVSPPQTSPPPTILHISMPVEAAAPAAPTEAQNDGRAFDVVMATFLLILVLPLMCLTALFVLGTSRGPLLFRQSRIGRGGRPFNCLKFRTMVEDADCAIEGVLNDSPEARAEWLAVQKIKCDPRVTPVGAFLRRYCLDELPQLFNVLNGEMSIVGPRPIVAEEIDRFGTNFADYCLVRPGITGIWQVSGRHLLSYDQRVALDAQYARSKCLSLDLRILWKTVPIVLLGENG